MIEWHKSKGAGFLLRLGGAALVGLACLAVVGMGGGRDGALAEYVLGLVGFVSASLGSLLLIVGPHLFDEIEVPAPWGRYRYRVAKPAPQQSEPEATAQAQSTARPTWA